MLKVSIANSSEMTHQDHYCSNGSKSYVEQSPVAEPNAVESKDTESDSKAIMLESKVCMYVYIYVA